MKIIQIFLLVLIVIGLGLLVTQRMWVPGLVEKIVEKSGEYQPPAEELSSALGGCYVGGCSSQVCSDDPGVITTCEWREEYACYRTAVCERQVSGECGWTETEELRACLNVAL